MMAKKPVVTEARMALNQFKEEIASELGISKPEAGLTNDITSRQAGSMGGKLGGEMTKRLIESAALGMVKDVDSISKDLE